MKLTPRQKDVVKHLRQGWKLIKVHNDTGNPWSLIGPKYGQEIPPQKDVHYMTAEGLLTKGAIECTNNCRYSDVFGLPS